MKQVLASNQTFSINWKIFLQCTACSPLRQEDGVMKMSINRKERMKKRGCWEGRKEEKERVSAGKTTILFNCKKV